ncbi:nuclear transport factor 2 family protein [Rhodoferax ferrireducens]|uniref:nuclear transport factor 2 family protein n=1 Tax=Rhodoferax ferrireducens TaxID=192843 RepID=UPI001E34ECFD|nr:nuclear transport factor 2 family protein [Rhodoferax ferrireducens]
MMSQEQTKHIAQEFLSRLGTGAEPEEIAKLFSPDLDLDIPGDAGALPWIGRTTGRGAIVNFISATRSLLEPLRFDVHDILASDSRAVILGELASRVTGSGKVIETPFAIVLTVSGGEITRFLMLEDSFAVSIAIRV